MVCQTVVLNPFSFLAPVPGGAVRFLEGDYFHMGVFKEHVWRRKPASWKSAMGWRVDTHTIVEPSVSLIAHDEDGLCLSTIHLDLKGVIRKRRACTKQRTSCCRQCGKKANDPRRAINEFYCLLPFWPSRPTR